MIRKRHMEEQIIVVPKDAQSGPWGPRALPKARHLGGRLLEMAYQACGAGSQRGEEAAPAGRRKRAVETDGDRASAGHPGAEADHRTTQVEPKAKRTAAVDGRTRWAQSATGLSIAQIRLNHAVVWQSLPGGCGATDADLRDCREQTPVWLSPELCAVTTGRMVREPSGGRFRDRGDWSRPGVVQTSHARYHQAGGRLTQQKGCAEHIHSTTKGAHANLSQ